MNWLNASGELESLIKVANTPEECQRVVKLLKDQIMTSPRPLERSGPTPEQCIDFFKYGYDIKETERRGWRLSGLPLGKTETVSSHMYRMALMAIVLDRPNLDMNRCIQMALVHDLAEAIVGDITPECGISTDEKTRLETEAMEKIVATMEDSPAAEKIKGLWIEYELDKSEEAHFVHDLDKLELALQTLEYEHKFNVKLDGFMNTARAHLKDPQMRKILDCIISRRPSL